MSQKLDLRQSQSLVMTPQLQQAIKLLQLSNIELSEYIEEELEKNPLLEKVDPADAAQESAERDDEQNTAKDDVDSAFENQDEKDFDAGSSMADIGAGGNSKFELAEDSFENRMSAEKTLREHLTEQLHMAFTEERDLSIGALLIDRLDESGYLREDVQVLAERWGCKRERIDNLLLKMRKFDPSGIFARDLADCLAIQLDEKGALDQPMQSLLDNLSW